MKEEMKKKLCKISKIVGFVVTFGFAVFGVLCAAMLIGNGSKKDDIKTLGSSLVLNEVRSERNSKPRKAPDYQNSVNLVDNAREFVGVYVTENLNPRSIAFNYNAGTSVWLVPVDSSKYYYFDCDYNGWWYGSTFCYSGTLSDFEDYCESVVATHEQALTNTYSDFKDNQRYYFAPSSSYFVITCASSLRPTLYVCDTMELPASSSVYLGENWNPLKAFGDTLSEKGGYLLTDESWTANSSTFKNLTISGLLFKYEGVVYDRIYMIARPLNSSAYPYVDSSGAIVERAITQNSGPNEIYVLDYVGFGQSWLYDGLLPSRGLLKVMVGGKADTPSPSGKLPYNGSLQWVTSSRSIQIIDNKGTTTGRYENRFGYLTDLEFINMLSEYESEATDVVNNGQMFGLFTNAFNSLLPILSIAILPNISLGMLLFIPLIGAIIVIIIRVVKK